MSLSDPILLGPLRLPNRIVMAPMTRNRAGAGDVPTDLNALYYAQRASAGLIISEGTQVSPEGKGYPGTPGVHTAEQEAGWRRVTSAVHERGGRIFAQLWHVGRISHPSLQPDNGLPVAPSALRPQGEAVTTSGPAPFVTPRALELAEIGRIVGDFSRAAECAKRAGFDGAELHGANGYLLDQFLRDSTNLREDRYGGPVQNRARLLLDCVDAVAAVFGAGSVGVKLSPLNPFNDIRDSDPRRTFGHAAEELGRRGLAYLHLTRGGDDGGFDWPALRKAFGGPVILNGGYDFAAAELALAEGAADLIAFGAAYLSNPDLVERFRRGAALNSGDRATFYGGDARGYTDYPVLDPDPLPIALEARLQSAG